MIMQDVGSFVVRCSALLRMGGIQCASSKVNRPGMMEALVCRV